MDYLELELKLSPLKPWAEIAIANLAELGFESFVDNSYGIMAYISNELFDKNRVNHLLNEIMSEEVDYNVNFRVIPHQNWNATWESEFEPVHVGNKLSILAPFHDKSVANEIQIEIMPKMSFGTGHHQTTQLMCEWMFDLDFKEKSVLDMGAGTGVLAILAEKFGAKNVLAVDIEDWSAENIVENCKRNNCLNIESRCGDIDCIHENEFDVILANINRNILVEQLPYYSNKIIKGGFLMLSGFLESDLDMLITVASKNGFTFLDKKNKDVWYSLKFIKSR